MIIYLPLSTQRAERAEYYLYMNHGIDKAPAMSKVTMVITSPG